MGEESVQRVELEGWDYVVKFQEKLHFICLNVSNRKEISEDDYALLRTVYKIYSNGEYPLYENKLAIPDVSAEQQGLFADTKADSYVGRTDGKMFDNIVSEPINETEDE